MEKLLERFLRYVKINTMSSEEGTKTPSTVEQFDLANLLKNELENLGLKDIKLTDECILTASLKSNCDSDLTIGFIAHLDTIPGFSGKNVNPQVFKNYDGKKIVLKGITLDPLDFPFLIDLKGKTLITTDGTTVLGADDKAGVAIIMQMLADLKSNPEIKHVNIKVAFTPDEEIGGGISSFNVKDFGADFAYTVDGGKFNEINYENFNAAHAIVKINGLDIHPGSAKNHMKNASLIAMEFHNMLPQNEAPMYTDGYEGFYHLCEIKGEVGNSILDYILRDHDLKKLNIKKQLMQDAATFLNKKYGANTCTVEIKDSYYNMYELLKKDMRSVEFAKNAIFSLGYTPTTEPIRGGTDGAKLTQMGLNTPNLGTGGYNCHGPYECACLEEMKIVEDIIIKIVTTK